MANGERLNPKKIMLVRRKTVTSNLKNLDISLPPNFYDPTGLLKQRIITVIEDLVPGLTYQEFIDHTVLGAYVYLEKLPDLLRLRGAQIGPQTAKWLESKKKLRSKSSSDKKYFIPNTGKVPDKTDQIEVMERQVKLLSVLENSIDGEIIYCVGENLLNRLKDVINKQDIFLSDFIYLRQKKIFISKGFYHFSEILGLGNKLGIIFDAVVRKVGENRERLDFICDQEFSGIITNINKVLEEYDNPNALVQFALDTLRRDAKKYFSP